MEKAKVYFTNLRTKPGKNLLDKLDILIKAAGMEKINFENQFTAIKIHFGEPGNLAYIRPNYVARVVELVKKGKGLPFLTDANTLYKGRRCNAVEHLDSAMKNGFGSVVTGCDTIIADGLKGTEYKEIEINQKNCKSAKIGAAIADADVIISLNHFKGHEMTGFGGALKNLGMGCASRGGKMEMHSSSQPKMNEDNCIGCTKCITNCSQNAITLNNSRKAVIDYTHCVGCGQCIAMCAYDAAQVVWNGSADICNEKIAEYTYAVLKDKQSFHINFIMNVSPDCDCWSNNDMPLVADIGIAASFDPIALDKASADLVNQAPALAGSKMLEKEFIEGSDKFQHVHPDTDWKVGLKHAEEIGIGTQEYDLIEI